MSQQNTSSSPDRGGLAARIAARLEARGDHVVLASPDEVAGRTQVAEFMRRHPISEFATTTHCAALDDPAPDELTTAGLQTAQRNGVLRLLHFAQQLDAFEAAAPPPVRVLTRGAFNVTGNEGMPGLASASITGFLRVARNEFANQRWCQIDLSPTGTSDEVNDLLHELEHGDSESEIA